VTFLDGLLWCGLRYHYDSLWAAALAHGCNNTIGLTAYFVVGPVGAFW
jgi:membrane protease YdiL (CAAX protease family)